MLEYLGSRTFSTMTEADTNTRDDESLLRDMDLIMADCQASVNDLQRTIAVTDGIDPLMAVPKTPPDESDPKPSGMPLTKKAKAKAPTIKNASVKPKPPENFSKKASPPIHPKDPPPKHLLAKSTKEELKPKWTPAKKKQAAEKKRPATKPAGPKQAATSKWEAKPPPKQQPRPDIPTPPPAVRTLPTPPPPVVAKQPFSVVMNDRCLELGIARPPPPKAAGAASAPTNLQDVPWRFKRQHRGGKDNPVSLWWKAYNKAKAEGPDAQALFLRVFDKPG